MTSRRNIRTHLVARLRDGRPLNAQERLLAADLLEADGRKKGRPSRRSFKAADRGFAIAEAAWRLGASGMKPQAITYALMDRFRAKPRTVDKARAEWTPASYLQFLLDEVKDIPEMTRPDRVAGLIAELSEDEDWFYFGRK